MSVSSYGSLADQISLKVDETDRLTDVEASDDEDPPFVTLHNRLIAVDLNPRLPSESSESAAGTYRVPATLQALSSKCNELCTHTHTHGKNKN